MKQDSQDQSSRRIPVLITLLVICGTWFLQSLPRILPEFDAVERLEAMTYDLRMRRALTTGTQAANELGVVFIDDESLNLINRSYGFTWPWPRQLYGRLITELTAQGAKSIAFDILFLENQTDQEGTSLRIGGETVGSDAYFTEQLREHHNTILSAAVERNSRGGTALIPPMGFTTNAWALGHINSDPDPDGVLRRVRPYYDTAEAGRLWHLGIVLACAALEINLDDALVNPHTIILQGADGLERVIPLDQNGFLLVDWTMLWNDPRLLKANFQSILQEEIRRSNGRTNTPFYWQDKVVVVGSIGLGNNISDVGITPLSNQTYLVSKHWNVANSVIQGRFIRQLPYGATLFIIALLSSVSAAATWHLRALVSPLVVLLLIAGYGWLSDFSFAHYRYWLPLITPLLGALLTTHISMILYRFFAEERERRRIRSIFAKVVAPDVVSELLKVKKVTLGGARRRVTIFFADIRGFTHFAEQSWTAAEDYIERENLPPGMAEAHLENQARDLLETVNLYLSTISDIIKQHQGTLDKYIGDCVMAFWGAPTESEDQATQCVMAAVEAQRALYDLNQERAQENLKREKENLLRRSRNLPPLPLLDLLTLGTGINTGTATVGLMGSDSHIVNYTVFGREVNLASRLEASSGSGRILVTHATYESLRQSNPGLASFCDELPAATFKGIRAPVRIYEINWRRIQGGRTSYETNIVAGSQADDTEPLC